MKYYHYLGFLALLAALIGCASQSVSQSPQPVATSDSAAVANDLSFSSRGDASRGQELYVRCASCHATSTAIGYGPGLAGLFSAAGPVLPSAANYGGMLPNGEDRTETNVAAWIRSGGQGSIGFMPAQTLDDQQMADLIAYLRSLEP